MTVHLVLVSVCCCVANSSFTDLRQGEQPIETLHLGRKAFIREALLVFLVRWVGTECASALLLWIAGVDFTEGVTVWWPIPIGLAIFLVFLVPYIRVMHRRLLAINFPFPSAFVWGAMLLYLTLELTFPTDNIYYLEGAGLMFFLSVYALLIPWPA